MSQYLKEYYIYNLNLDFVKLLKCLPVIVRELKQSHFWLVLSLGLWETKGEVKENT